MFPAPRVVALAPMSVTVKDLSTSIGESMALATSIQPSTIGEILQPTYQYSALIDR
jgi:hypothetical protein